MEINLIREKLADKLCSAEMFGDWLCLLQDTNPANYGVEEVEIGVSFKDIWVDIKERTFSFKNTYLSFSARLVGSNDLNGYDETFKKVVSGNGKFDFIINSQDVKIIEFSINNNLNLY